ncbi:MAG: hypothetical protein ACF8OB_09705 [Phycisphaeraceae bacterium JB051]
MNNRRGFLKRIGRWLLMGGLTAGSVHLAGQNKTNDTENDVCQRDGYCRKCPLLKACGTPTALSFKEAEK